MDDFRPNLLKAAGAGAGNGGNVNLRCPYCGYMGALYKLQGDDLTWIGPSQRSTTVPAHYSAGIRICPNNECAGVVFYVKEALKLEVSYPAELKHFERDGIPRAVRSSMEEAIKCESQQCYRAAALMIRRTLEELCKDKKATGRDLANRLEDLGKHIVIPKELLEGAHELRLLGNDAAHIEAKQYADVGREEIAAAIDLAKALLQATYQTSALLERLRNLRGKSGHKDPLSA
jgi:hypothetical protein